MKKIVVSKIKKELDSIGVEESVQQFILNNVDLYNSIIDEYKANPNQKLIWLITQLNGQTMNQINEQRKICKNNEGGSPDAFTQMMKDLKESAK